jgi:hypothetical protein
MSPERGADAGSGGSDYSRADFLIRARGGDASLWAEPIQDLYDF